MIADAAHPYRQRRSVTTLVAQRGMTLVEVLVSFAVLVITTVGSVSSFVMLNKYASNLRNLSVARALCQERIEQAMTLAYRPTDATPVLPVAPNSDPTANAVANTAAAVANACRLLGTSANYTNGVYSGGSNLQTSSESIPFYTQSEGTTVSNSAAVTYTRVTTVSPAALSSVSSAGATTSTSLNVLKFTVTVSYVYRGNTYTASMSTLRAPD